MLEQLVAAQNSPRTAAQKAKARREVKEDMSWDTNVRTTAYRAGFQDPHAPGFKASNGIDPRTGQQEAPTAVLAKKQERWDGDKGYISTIPGPLASETVSSSSKRGHHMLRPAYVPNPVGRKKT